MKLQIYKKENHEDKILFENEYQKEKIDFEINSTFIFEYKKYLVLKTVKQFHFKEFDNDLKTMVLQVFTEEVKQNEKN